MLPLGLYEYILPCTDIEAVYRWRIRDIRIFLLEYRQVSNIRRTKSQHLKILKLSCCCLCRIPWSQMLSRERRCSWSSADRRCSNYMWVIDNFIAYQGASYIRGFTVYIFAIVSAHNGKKCVAWLKYILCFHVTLCFRIVLHMICIVYERRANKCTHTLFCTFWQCFFIM